jgi:hypothetical protein
MALSQEVSAAEILNKPPIKKLGTTPLSEENSHRWADARSDFGHGLV